MLQPNYRNVSGTDSAAQAAKRRTLLVLSGTRHPAALRALNGCGAFNTKGEPAALICLGGFKSFSESSWASHIIFMAKILKEFGFLDLFINDSFSSDSLFFRYEFIRLRQGLLQDTQDSGSLILSAVLL